MSIISHRHDILVLFDVTNGNPNGDPDAGNMPRVDPTTNKGLISDVCLKRKIRNYVSDFLPILPKRKSEDENAFNIFIQQGRILNNEIKEAIKQSSEGLPKDAKDKQKAEAAMLWLCREFYDIRTFGAVLSTGEKKEVLTGSAYGQVRGPVQFTFSQSQHPITPLEVTITRCAVTKPEDEQKERTMGNKHIVPYGLYVGKIFISPVFAKNTGFSEDDLKLFFQALEQMFTHDRSAARGDMVVRGIYDFEHVGTQAEANADQNKREASLGCEHAHKLFEGIKINLKQGKEYPSEFTDYDIKSAWSNDTLPKGVKLNLRHEGTSIIGQRPKY